MAKKILSIVRREAYYFAPQGQTKIINEGWATYWHSKIMTAVDPLHASEIVDYCDQHAGIVANHQGQLNPYRLGLELLRYIEYRWNTGKYGLEYLSCDDPKTRAQWDTQAGKGREKLFEIRKFHNDITFLDEFLDEDFCHHSKMFLYSMDPRTGKYVIASRDFPEIKKQLLSQLTNFGQPIIKVVDANYNNRNELYLKHTFEAMNLKHEYTLEALKSIFIIWNRPVHLETMVDGVARRVSFDGKNHSVEKVS